MFFYVKRNYIWIFSLFFLTFEYFWKLNVNSWKWHDKSRAFCAKPNTICDSFVSKRAELHVVLRTQMQRGLIHAAYTRLIEKSIRFCRLTVARCPPSLPWSFLRAWTHFIECVLRHLLQSKLDTCSYKFILVYYYTRCALEAIYRSAILYTINSYFAMQRDRTRPRKRSGKKFSIYKFSSFVSKVLIIIINHIYFQH